MRIVLNVKDWSLQTIVYLDGSIETVEITP
jgi:hypothetical protein